jgi:hypothetical protein
MTTITLSPGRGGGPRNIHPHLDPPPSRGRIVLGNFHGSEVTNPACKIYLFFGIWCLPCTIQGAGQGISRMAGVDRIFLYRKGKGTGDLLQR